MIMDCKLLNKIALQTFGNRITGLFLGNILKMSGKLDGPASSGASTRSAIRYTRDCSIKCLVIEFYAGEV
jgi:hypothetical protein